MMIAQCGGCPSWQPPADGFGPGICNRWTRQPGPIVRVLATCRACPTVLYDSVRAAIERECEQRRARDRLFYTLPRNSDD